MIDTLKMDASKCRHGLWSAHNAILLNDGTTIDDPGGKCSGGIVWVEGRQYGISHLLAMFLRSVEVTDE